MAENKSIAERQTGLGATALLYTIVVLAILILVNYLAFRFNRSVDLTSNRRFTLSQETQNAVGKIKQEAKIVYFDMPTNFDQAKGLLDRYKNLNPNIHIEYVDFQKDPLRTAAYGLRYQGTAFVEVGDQREEAKTFDEQGITGAFLKLSKGVRKVCFVTGNKEKSLDDSESTGLSALKGWLQRDNYLPEALPLIEKGSVPEDCKVVAVVGPQSDYPAAEVNALKTYVQEKGGRVLFLLDPPLDLRNDHIPANKELTELLSSWGVSLESDVVIEATKYMAIFGPLRVPVTHYESHSIVNDLKGGTVMLPIVRSMKVVKSAGKAVVSPLFSTGEDAVAKTDLTTETIKFDDPKNAKGPFVLGAAGTYDNGRFVVVGTSAFVQNGDSSKLLNRDLVQNAVNWLSSDEDLISIHQKDPEDRRLSPSGTNPIWFFDLLVLPAFIIGGGIFVYVKRR